MSQGSLPDWLASIRRLPSTLRSLASRLRAYLHPTTHDKGALLVSFLGTAIIIFGLFVIRGFMNTPAPSDDPAPAITTPEVPALDPTATIPADTPTPAFINLQPTLDRWLSENPKINSSIVIYDLDHQEVAAQHNPDRPMSVASVYKLFYTYAVAAEISAGRLSATDFFVTTSDYRAGNYALGQCLYLMLRESYNGCADHMHGNKTYDALADSLITGLGLTHTTNHGLTSSASDLIILLKYYYKHSELSAEMWSLLSTAMLNQPPTQIDPGTTYDWRQGLPSGFSANARVYNKVGWAWNGKSWDTYADAAIIEFPELGRHYAAAVITSGVTSPTATPLATLGKYLSTAIESAPVNY